MRLLPMGDTGLLVEGEPKVLALHRALAGSPRRPGGVLDLVPAATTLLIRFDPRIVTGTDVAAWVRVTRASSGVGSGSFRRDSPDPTPEDAGRATSPDGAGPPDETPAVVIEVTYDGEDLDDVGRLTGLGAHGVVRAHTGTPWTVAFTGFAPGFGYLIGGDPRLQVPRLDVPRTRVPAGAVGLAGPYTGVYPRPSPGGWRLIGHTVARVWDLDRDPPALLQPGSTARFVTS